VRESKKKGILS